MSRRTRTRSAATLLLGVLVGLLLASPTIVVGRAPASATDAPSENVANVAPTLGADGVFRGAAGVAGTIDTHAWTLMSDLASGQPPRLIPARAATDTSVGSWSALGSNGSGNGAINSSVYALAVSGSNLYVGGSFTDAGGLATADHIAMWNGTTWSALGSNGSGDGALNADVFALTVLGTDVVVGGGFQNAGGNAAADFIAEWNGSAWTAVGAANFNGEVLAVVVSGSNVYAGGNFTNAAGIPAADFVAKWSGTAWSALGSNGAGDGALDEFSYVDAFAVSGADLYVGGGFTDAAGIATADNIAKWSGTAWSGVGSNGSGDGALNSDVNAIAVSGTDIFVGGSFFDAAGIATADDVARWSGTAWSALGSNGVGDGALSGSVYALAVSGSDLYVGGSFTDAGGIATADFVATWSGTAWSALGSNGAGDGALGAAVLAQALAVSSSGIIVGGHFTNAAGIATADYLAKWTFSTGAHTAGDYDGNGSTDLAVFRPSSGVWFIRNATNAEWGTTGDIPVPGDYDGNGTTDLAVFRPGSGSTQGTWYIRNVTNAQWGISTDIPVPGDYDGNGTTDLAVFRPSTGVWFIRNVTNVEWGTTGDIPVPGDYDGNGTTDLAVFRPGSGSTQGTWYIRNVTNAQWGVSSDIPVPGDYDGNGTTDLAVFRPGSGSTQGTWYVRNVTNAQWGVSTDVPVPGDYDGNGTTDLAVFRPGSGSTQGYWYIAGQTNAQWGISTDTPLSLPSAIYRRFFP